MQRRSDWGRRSGREGSRSGADYEPSIDRYSGELVRGRRQRWVSPERSVRDRSPHEGREYRRGSEGYDYACNVVEYILMGIVITETKAIMSHALIGIAIIEIKATTSHALVEIVIIGGTVTIGIGILIHMVRGGMLVVGSNVLI